MPANMPCSDFATQPASLLETAYLNDTLSGAPVLQTFQSFTHLISGIKLLDLVSA